MNRTFKAFAIAAAIPLMASVAPLNAHADPVVATACSTGGCAPIPPVVAGAVIATGIFKKNIADNFEASKSESGVLNKAVRATTGISIGDIQKHGLAGGENSEVRKAGRFFAHIFGW